MASKHALAKVEGVVGRKDYFMVDPFSIIRADILSRTSYGDQKDIDLKNDIESNGVKEPIKVQKHDDDNRLYLINGSRRLWCCERLKEEGIVISAVPVMLVDKKLSPSELLFEALSSNNGKDLTPFEEAEAFRRQRAYGLEVKYIAERVGKSIPFVYDRLKLVNASSETRQSVESGSVSITAATHAISLSGGDPVKQKQAIRKTQRPKMKIKWDKQSKCLISDGFNDAQSDVISSILVRGFCDKLRSVGLDPSSFKISVCGIDDNQS